MDKEQFDKFTMRHNIDVLLMELWKVGASQRSALSVHPQCPQRAPLLPCVLSLPCQLLQALRMSACVEHAA